ncbi:MAG: DUF983 domain-containing protein [Bdellovibrionia bacterium]
MTPETRKGPVIIDILKARCPVCRTGKITQNLFKLNQKCPVCGHNFYPEPGYYLGAMMVSFLVTAMLTVPVVIVLKFAGAEVPVLVLTPFAEFAILGPILLYYARIIWLYLEHSMTNRLGDRR